MTVLDYLPWRGQKPQKISKGRPNGPHPDVQARIASIRNERASGAAIEELATKYGLSVAYIRTLTVGIGANPIPQQFLERDVVITSAYEGGENSQQLADRYGITRERVCQILRRSNAIEHRAERRKIIGQAIAEETEALRDAARAEWEEKIARAVELVKDGESLAEAGRITGLTRNKVNYLSYVCKQAGIETKHGRWRDHEPKIARVRELRAQGNTWDVIGAVCTEEGLGPVNGTWVSHHCPDLVRPRGQRKATTPKPQADQPAPAQPFVMVEPTRRIPVWTPENERQLVDYWLNGNSAQQCVDLLGVGFTRNMVIGKINRLREARRLVPETTA